jgi:hypothetical protein
LTDGILKSFRAKRRMALGLNQHESAGYEPDLHIVYWLVSLEQHAHRDGRSIEAQFVKWLLCEPAANKPSSDRCTVLAASFVCAAPDTSSQMDFSPQLSI